MGRRSARARGMKLAEFHRYMDEQSRQLNACYKEVEEVQFGFNDIFKRELDAWQEQFAYCFPRLAAQRKELPAPFAQHVDRVEAEERERIRKEIAELEERIRTGRAEMDRLLAEAQAESDALRKANPELNDEEERLKALVVQYENEYAQAYEEMEELHRGLWGQIAHYGKIRRLKRAQRTAKRRQAEMVGQLRKVREAWNDKLKQAGERQAELRSQWQTLSMEVAQSQGRRDHLDANWEALAEQAALQRVLEELDSPPDVPGDLGEGLRELVRRNKVRWDYEKGLQAVAEALGLLKGVGEGIKRFGQSVQTVLQEQRRYNLKEVEVRVPESVIAINQTWAQLAEKVRDEKQMGKQPLEFSRLVDQYIHERLTDESIQSYFERMGEALNAATAAWK